MSSNLHSCMVLITGSRLFPYYGNGIFYPGRDFSKDDSLNDFIFFQLTQLVDQRLLTDPEIAF